MPEYAKMKNAELEALLKERGLPHAGKKADMVDRLNKNDESKKSAEVTDTDPSKSTTIHPEDEIDWDDDEDPSAKTIGPATTVAKAGGEGQIDNPQQVPNQVADIDPAETADLSVKQPDATADSSNAAKAEEKEPTPDFTRGLAASSVEDEIAKRKKRAERFGIKLDEDEELKKLERLKKFGTSGPPKGLDEALPERTKKRARDTNDEGIRGRDKRRGGRFGGRRGGGRGRDNWDDRGREQSKPNGGSWMSETDRAKAAARKEKWG